MTKVYFSIRRSGRKFSYVKKGYGVIEGSMLFKFQIEVANLEMNDKAKALNYNKIGLSQIYYSRQSYPQYTL